MDQANIISLAGVLVDCLQNGIEYQVYKPQLCVHSESYHPMSENEGTQLKYCRFEVKNVNTTSKHTL